MAFSEVGLVTTWLLIICTLPARWCLGVSPAFLSLTLISCLTSFFAKEWDEDVTCFLKLKVEILI